MRADCARPAQITQSHVSAAGGEGGWNRAAREVNLMKTHSRSRACREFGALAWDMKYNSHHCRGIVANPAIADGGAENEKYKWLLRRGNMRREMVTV